MVSRFFQSVLLIICLIGIFNFSQARPVLIAVELINSEQIIIWKNSEYPTYAFLNQTAIAEVEDAQISFIKEKGFWCEIIDDAPWQDSYFIISVPPALKIELPVKPIWQSGEIFLLKLPKDEIRNLFDLKLKYVPLRRTVLPNRFWDNLTQKIVPLRRLNWDPFIQSLVDQVNTDSIFSYVRRMQNFKTRLWLSDSSFAASEWLRQKFNSWGYNAEFDSFYLDSTAFGFWPDTGYERNVIATMNGTINPAKIYIICGHFDDIIYPETSIARYNAPGADDNASGVAAALEAARIFRNYAWEPTIKFIGWAVEEPGYYGSDYYARRADSLNLDIGGVVNLDMIAYVNDLILDCNAQYSNSISFWLADLFYQAGQIYSPTVTIYRELFGVGSDDYSFAIRGFPAIWGGERWYFTNPHWHQTTDIIDTLSAVLFTNITKTAIASLAILATYPGAVPAVTTWDFGDGNRLLVSWTPNSETDVIGYKIYWGLTSGVYTDSDFVSGRMNTSDTLTGLLTDSIYYITVRAVDNSGHLSFLANEIIGSPHIAPLAPIGVTAIPIDSGVRITWQQNFELDLAGYRVYRRINENPNYDSLNLTLLTDTIYNDLQLSGANKYYYTIRAFDLQGNASPMSCEVYSRPITLDQGILIVDETRNGNNPPDSLQDRFYRGILPGFRYTEYEYGSTTQKPVFADLAPYSTILWHGDDYGQLMAWENIPILKDYLNLGGNLWFMGWKPTGNLRNNTSYPVDFEPGSFIYDYLKIVHVDLSGSNDSFQGAVGLLNYPDVDVDPTKVPLAAWGGTMRYIEALTQIAPTQIIYNIDMKNNSSPFEGLPCAVRYLNDDNHFVFFGFPLYYMNQEQARAAAQQVMNDFNEPYNIAETPKVKPAGLELKLAQNHPNPFNRKTIINYQIPNAGFVSLKIYNSAGEMVKIMLNDFQKSGDYSINWDCRSKSGIVVANGIYFYKLRFGSSSQLKKMVVFR